MYKLTAKLKRGFILFIISGFICLLASIEASAAEPIVIVIDPGHGGENLGAQYDGYTEKEMTMVVAKAMQEELEQYENVVVYLTHDADIDMNLKERAQFAKDKKADFLFSLHFNASVNHNLFGAEVWIPAYDDFYVKGYQFAEIQMQQFEEMGLYSRGIKTKLNNEGEDYYGILRHCSAMDIPSVIIEHCHLDHVNDKTFYQQNEEQWREFGRRNAEAVAQYFGLSSTAKGVDYSEFPKKSVDAPIGAVKPDETAPEISSIEILSVDKESGELTVKLSASDKDSYILYYKYSFDGGLTYSDLHKWSRPVWNKSDLELTVKITAPFDKEIDLQVCVYNGFDISTESNCITLEAIPSLIEEKAASAPKKIYREIRYDYTENTEIGLADSEKNKLVVLILIISFFITLVLLAMIKMIIKLKPRNRRRKKG